MPQGDRPRRHRDLVRPSVHLGTAAVRCGARHVLGGALDETRLSGLPLVGFYPLAASRRNTRKKSRIDRPLRAMRDDRVMGRSGAKCTTDTDLAAGLFAPSREDRFEADVVQADVRIGNHPPKEVAQWRLPAVKILNDHLETASAAWQAYRQPKPQDWFNLLDEELSVLPQLRQTVLELLEELPTNATGLGATEMRMLELI